MADMGFLPDVRRILDQTMDDRQTLLFSATLDGDVQTLTDRYQNDPALHEIGDPEPDLSTVEHRFIKIRKPDRMDVAADLITEAGATVVFVRTRHGVDRLARQLKPARREGRVHPRRAEPVPAFEGPRALFTDGKVDALVATDVAARGIHVDGVACVLHYDPPAEIKDYVHRSGWTARAGAGGTVISFLDPAQVKPSQKMQRELGIEAELEAPPTPRPRPAVDDAEHGADDGGRAAKGRDRTGRDGKGRDNGNRGGKGRSDEGGDDRTDRRNDSGRGRDRSNGGRPRRDRAGSDRVRSDRSRSDRSTDRPGDRTDRPSGRRDGDRRSTANDTGRDRSRSRRDRTEDAGDNGSRGRGRRSGPPSAGAGPKGRGRAGGSRRDGGTTRDDAGGRGRRGDDRNRGRGRAAAWDEVDGEETTRPTDARGAGQGRETSAGTGRAGPSRSGKAKAKAKSAGTGKTRAKRATKRSGRSRPPNRKGKLGAKGRRSKTSG